MGVDTQGDTRTFRVIGRKGGGLFFVRGTDPPSGPRPGSFATVSHDRINLLSEFSNAEITRGEVGEGKEPTGRVRKFNSFDIDVRL